MSESHFYLTEYKQKQFPVFQSHPAKKTILKAFKEWPKVMKSVTEYLLPEQYYNNKTFKPGMDVYRALLDEQGPFLKQYYFNIPLTLTGEPYTYDVIHSCGGEVIRKMQVTKNQIDSILGIKTISPYYQSAESLKLLEQFCECYDSPLFISKISNDRIGYKTTIINQGEYKDKIKTLPKREEEIYQKFIIPYQFKANIIRLHLYTLRSKKQTLTNAIKILNKTPMYDPATRSINSLMFCVNFNKQDSFDTVELIGKPLKSYIDMTQSLVGYIEDYAGICVTEVVADYIMDYHKVPWFLSLKSIKSSTKMIKDVKLTAEQLQQLSLSTICKLCGLYFMKEEVTKMVTYKLIYGFLNHIKSRGVDPGLIQPKSNPNLQCKICTTCYNMIMKEIELYKLSTELARMQNTIEGIEDITDIGVSGGSTRREGELGRKTQQYRWRLMINLNGLKNVEELNEYKGNDLELQFKIFGMKMKIPLWKSEGKTPGVNTPYEFSIGEQCGQSSSSSHYLMSKSIGKQSTALNLQSKSYSPYQPPSPSIQLSYLKTLYFFSKHPDITQLLKDQQILLRITINKDWNNWVCQGNSRILGYLTNATELGQIYGTEVYMFFKDMKYLKMGLSLGLACDGVQEVPGNEKVKYKQIEIVKGGYYLCQPLPINWLELFDQL